MIGPLTSALLAAVAMSTAAAATAQWLSGHGTHFAGMGSPVGGCGVPPELAVDDAGNPLPYVALNTNSEFNSGSNCGRWVEIVLKENCEGAGNSAFSICNGGSFKQDSMSGDVIYGYTMDSCADENFWCQDDAYHLDISRDYLSGLGMVGNNWNGRKIDWRYISSPAPGWEQSRPKFALKDGSKWTSSGTFWATTIIYNTSNGIGAVEQKVGGSWESLSPLTHLGNMYVLARPDNAKNGKGGAGQTITLRVKNVDGEPYGEYAMEWVCGTEVCGSWTEASSTVIV